MGNAEELARSSQKLIKKVTAGKVSVDDGLAIADLMERRRHIIETEDHERRLQAIEHRADERAE